MSRCSHAKSVILIVLVSLLTSPQASASEKSIADILSRTMVRSSFGFGHPAILSRDDRKLLSSR